MCGIAGILDLHAGRYPEPSVLARMSRALVHRGPDDHGFYVRPGLGLAVRRLSVVDVAGSPQPVANEDASIVAVFNGELFDFRERRAELQARGHTFRTGGDAEVVVHLWEEQGEELLRSLRGQFALALFDTRQGRLLLARDRFGICPLHWTIHDERLYFASEIKALLATGVIPRQADPGGLDDIFTMFAMPGRRTAFRNIQSLRPGGCLTVARPTGGGAAELRERQYWDFDFPDAAASAQADEFPAPRRVAQFAELFERAVARRLRADVPVAAYLSGGVDSAWTVATASRLLGQPIQTFTAKVTGSGDEEPVARTWAAKLGGRYQAVTCTPERLAERLPAATLAADCPVVDINAGSLLELSAACAAAGYKVVLTGEGADEALAGYVWHKVQRLIESVAFGSYFPLQRAMEWGLHWWYPTAPRGYFRAQHTKLGGSHAPVLMYNLSAFSRWRLLHPQRLAAMRDWNPYDQLELPVEAMRRWHPLNQALYVGYKTMLPGLLLNHRGDRAAMNHSVETRYPYLDEDLVDFCAQLPVSWKLRGWRGDKHLLRQAARRCLPVEVAHRRKKMFRASFAETLLRRPPAFVAQLCSAESLAQTGYFDVDVVRRILESYRLRAQPWQIFQEIGMACVVATQLWHHLYLGGGLCELPVWTPPQDVGDLEAEIRQQSAERASSERSAW